MRTFWWLVPALMMAACSEEDPCGDYVDYICDCHADDPDFDCEELRTTYANADAAVQDECAIQLNEQEDADADEGLECGI